MTKAGFSGKKAAAWQNGVDMVWQEKEEKKRQSLLL